jgi:hypothetical protein
MVDQHFPHEHGKLKGRITQFSDPFKDFGTEKNTSCPQGWNDFGGAVRE